MRVMLIFVGILFGSIILYKVVMGLIFNYMISHQPHVVTVSTMKVEYSDWQPQLKASGSARAIKGVSVTSELAGLVQSIYFTPGAIVNQGTVLVQLTADSDNALLNSLQANAELAQINYTRDKAQFLAKGVSKATVDADAANLKSLQAQVAQQAAIVAKKTIRAPFTGRLGVSAVNPGQYVNPGDKVVTLQQLDPIYIDFYVPQEALVRLNTGLPVNVTIDSYPDKVFPGAITTIDPLVDSNTRNAEIEATVANPTHDLAPGMFTNVVVLTGKPQRFLTLPQTAVSFNPYGEIVYVVKATGKDKKGNLILTATQHFVTTGELRGDQVTILSGLKEGDIVVSAGQLKLKNGSQIAINNKIMPSNNPAPKVIDS